MRAALRHLCQHGAEALKPKKVNSKPVAALQDFYVAKPSREVWHRPLVSKRVANDIRKQAIRDGTYGTFDADNGIGWEPSWDLILHSNRHKSPRVAADIQPPKKITKRIQHRQERAQTIEQNLQQQQQLLDNYYTEKEQARVQDKSFEARFKRMLRVGGGR
mmetsp:Transcript_24809/g.46337  ORF Transcript_24809/g.46337 Transcript_24809/m.46337 type:complete len:161 (+) Transcript_24809:408-890(+)